MPTPPSAPRPSGGMPKWLIILLVVLLVIIIGCCGGVTLCSVLLNLRNCGIDKFTSTATELGKNANANISRQTESSPLVQSSSPFQIVEPGTPQPNGTAQPGNAPMPAGFPSDIPVYSGLTPAGSNASGNIAIVMLRGQGDKASLLAYYKEQMPKNGWQEMTPNNAPSPDILAFGKEGRMASVMASDGGGGQVLVQIGYSKQQ